MVSDIALCSQRVREKLAPHHKIPRGICQTVSWNALRVSSSIAVQWPSEVCAMTLTELFGIELPLIQAPMAGSQGSELAIAVSNAGGLGSLPCALLTVDAMRAELAAIRAATDRPFNVNFFCHAPPAADDRREAAWRELLSPYYREYGIEAGETLGGALRAPFSAAAADVLEQFTPKVVSF